MKLIKVIVNGRRSIKDLAVEYYGSVQGIELIVATNPQYTVTDVPVAGSVLLIQENANPNAIVKEYDKLDYMPVSGEGMIVNNIAGIFDDSFGSEFE
jgi:hypothetical protein